MMKKGITAPRASGVLRTAPRATFYAEPISDIIAPVVSIFIYAVAMKRILKKPVIPNF